MEERLQKILSHAGYGSRRSCEDIIRESRVQVNGQIATIGSKADPEKDKILVDGKPIGAIKQNMYILVNKPREVITTLADDDPRPNVRSLINIPGYMFPVGRLDYDSEGLVLMTNDGELANYLTHPRYEHEKEYKVLVAKRPDDEQLAAWRRGVVLEDGFHTGKVEAQFVAPFGKGAWLRVVMKEGHKRQIRETGRTIGLPVAKIIRTRIGKIYLGNLKPGEWRYLTQPEINSLKPENKTEKWKKPVTTKKA
jgi:23S rRNA pseudouridine2605 synthase